MRSNIPPKADLTKHGRFLSRQARILLGPWAGCVFLTQGQASQANTLPTFLIASIVWTNPAPATMMSQMTIHLQQEAGWDWQLWKALPSYTMAISRSKVSLGKGQCLRSHSHFMSNPLNRHQNNSCQRRYNPDPLVARKAF